MAMYSPDLPFRYPIQMAKNKTKSQKKKTSAKDAKIVALENKLAKLAVAKRATPFTDAGGSAGQYLGGFIPIPGAANIGKHVGRFLGAGVGSIFGSGDYQMVGQPAKYNVLSGSPPKFSSTRTTNVVCHREFLGNINGTTAFTNQSFPLQPGVSLTFPWLSSIAASYQEYRIHGIVFEFNPLITDFVTSGAPGVVVMATNYNADAPAYSSKIAMENSEYAVAVKPTQKLMHMIECEQIQTVLPNRYIRTGGVPSNQDLRLYDWGNFQLATQGNPNQLLGELWVTYCIEFFKPVLPISTSIGQSDHFVRSNTSGTNTFGSIQLSVPVNEIGCVVSANSITFPAGSSGYYLVEVFHTGTGAVLTVANTSALVNCSLVPAYNNGTYSLAQSPLAIASATMNLTFVVLITSPGSLSSITFVAQTVPTTSNIDVVISSLGEFYA